MAPRTKTKPVKHETFPIREGLNHVPDGWLLYQPAFLDAEDASRLFASLRDTVPWEQRPTKFGCPLPRLTAFYGDVGLIYRYTGVTHDALPWTPELQLLRERIEKESAASFNCTLLNRYRHGNDSVDWHTDHNPKYHGPDPVIASASLARHDDSNSATTTPGRSSTSFCHTGVCSSWARGFNSIGNTACRKPRKRSMNGST